MLVSSKVLQGDSRIPFLVFMAREEHYCILMSAALFCRELRSMLKFSDGYLRGSSTLFLNQLGITWDRQLKVIKVMEVISNLNFGFKKLSKPYNLSYHLCCINEIDWNWFSKFCLCSLFYTSSSFGWHLVCAFSELVITVNVYITLVDIWKLSCGGSWILFYKTSRQEMSGLNLSLQFAHTCTPAHMFYMFS